jgi:hypothetical protein
MDDKTMLALLGMVLVACMISIWVLCGHDGAVFMTGLAIVAGLAGYVLPSPFQKAESKLEEPSPIAQLRTVS